MTMATLRKVGGSVMVAIPPALLDVAEMQAGMEVGLTVSEGTILIRSRKKRPYTLADLLSRCDPGQPQGEDEWVNAPPVGGEIL